MTKPGPLQRECRSISFVFSHTAFAVIAIIVLT